MSALGSDGALRLPPSNGQAPDTLAIVLHGVGSTPEAMLDLALTMSSGLPAAAIVVPAGFEPFDCGSEGRQWFSIAGVTEANRPARVAAALPRLDAMIDEEAARAGVSRDATALVGFSQGAIMALHLAATAAPVGAVASLAGRLAGPVCAGDGPRPPVLLSHGADDRVIPVEQQTLATLSLRQAGCDVAIQTLARHGHAIAPAQVAAVVQHVHGYLPTVIALKRAS